MARITHHLVEQDIALSEWADLNQISSLGDLLDIGAVYLNQKRLRNETPLVKDDYLRIHHQPKRYQMPVVPAVILELQPAYLIVNKPAGIPTHETLDNAVENLKVDLETRLGQSLYAPHRLDVSTSGLLLFARNREFNSFFSKLLESGDVIKEYHCLSAAKEPLATGELVHYMKPSPRCPKALSERAKEGWKECRLEILSSENDTKSSLAGGPLSIRSHLRLITGRTHQIRAQLGFEGAPILGDTLYGPLHDIDGTLHQNFLETQTSAPIALMCTRLAFDGKDYALPFTPPSDEV